MNLLLIDDDEEQRQIFKDSVELFMKDNGCEIVVDEATTKDEGIRKLRDNSFDAAVVDLRLDKNHASSQGNEIIEEIKATKRLPITVISGHIGDLEDKFRAKTFFFDYYDRGSVDYDKILSQFCGIYNTGITKVLNNRGRIDADITNIFWKHFPTALPQFIKYKNDNPGSDVEKVVLRYLAAHIHEYLEIDADNNLDSFLDIEYYIKPLVKSNVFTGDILLSNEDRTAWVVLTPACDLAIDSKRTTPKAKFVTLALIDSFDNVQSGKKADQIKGLNGNRFDLRYHYLPHNELFHGGYIDFQCLRSVSIEKLQELYTPQAIITIPFRRDIISRFSMYYSRQGQPTLS